MTQIRHNDGQEGTGISYPSLSVAASPDVSLSLSSRVQLASTVNEVRGNSVCGWGYLCSLQTANLDTVWSSPTGRLA